MFSNLQYILHLSSADVPRPSQARNVKVLKDETDLSRAFITWDPPLKPNGHVCKYTDN